MSDRLLILGHTGFLGRHVQRVAAAEGWQTFGASLSNGFDLRVSGSLERAVTEVAPTVVVNCAAHVGGLAYSKDRQATILLDNMQMVLETFAFLSSNPKIKLINPIANCAYPGDLAEFREDNFWSGEIHPSVLGYGGVRRFSVLASQAFREQYAVNVIDISLPNLYGPGDHLDPVRAHALGAMVYRLLTAQRDGHNEVVIWGSGKPIREWLFVEDAARALVSAANKNTDSRFINVGSGEGISVAELADMIASVVGYQGTLTYDTSMADGAKEKRMIAENALALLAWQPRVSLRHGLELTVADVKDRLDKAGGRL